MKKTSIFLWVLWVMSLGLVQAREPISMTFTLQGKERQALVYPVAKANKSKSTKDHAVPVVFCFHGHGGSSLQASQSFRMHEAWPDALVIYPQGLPTPGQLSDPEGKRNGWQSKLGDKEDRDLLFFDAMLTELSKKYQIDAKQVFVMGHSNGGGFTYLLWAYRGDKIAAVAPCAALSLRISDQLKPKPCLHIAGKNDGLVKFTWQQRMMSAVKRINGCQDEGEVWAKECLIYRPLDGKMGAPMLQYIHDGTHLYPENATSMMVKFFKEVGSD
jgi:polyhydroxybutyrate depolymerase